MNKENQKLIGFTDSDFAGNLEYRKSTSRYSFKYGECLISWKSSKQNIVALSSTEAEYIGLTKAVQGLTKDIKQRKFLSFVIIKVR